MDISSDKKTKRILIFILIVSSAIHIAYFSQLRDTPYFTSLLLDSAWYHANALDILQEGWLGQSVFFMAPLYTYFLAVIYKLFGPDIGWVLWLQCGLSTITTLIFYFIGTELFNSKTGLLSAALATFYGVFVFYSGLLLKTQLTIFFTCLFILVALRSCKAPSTKNDLLSGLILGILICMRGNFLLVLAGLMVWAAFLSRPGTLRLKPAVALFLGAAMIIAPITLRNYIVGKDFILVNSAAGMNFFIGNNPKATGYNDTFLFARPNPFFEEQDYRERAEKVVGRKLKPSEVSDYWMNIGLAYARENPLDFALLQVRKLLIFFNNHEKADNYNYYFMKTITPALQAGFLPYGVIVLLASLGIFLGRWRSPPFLLLYFFIITYTLSVVLFFIKTRYRLPIVPALIPLAAYTLLEGWQKISKMGKKELAIFAFLAVILAWGIFRPIHKNDLSIAHSNYGSVFQASGRLDEAENEFKKALAIHPVYKGAPFNLGKMYLAKGLKDEAMNYFKMSLAIDRGYVDARIYLASIYLEKTWYEKAVAEYRDILMMKPNHAQARNNLGSIFIAQGKYDEALIELNRAITFKPDYADAHYNLAIVHAAKGKQDKANQEYQAAIKINPALKHSR